MPTSGVINSKLKCDLAETIMFWRCGQRLRYDIDPDRGFLVTLSSFDMAVVAPSSRTWNDVEIKGGRSQAQQLAHEITKWIGTTEHTYYAMDKITLDGAEVLCFTPAIQGV